MRKREEKGGKEDERSKIGNECEERKEERIKEEGNREGGKDR